MVRLILLLCSQQAMSSFSAALASGQLGPLMGQFGLGEEVANAAAQGGKAPGHPQGVGSFKRA